jgi:hypothetical protein
MHPQKPLFVGGSRNGIREQISSRPTLTFVDGYLVAPDSDGSLKKPINATVEMYVLDRLEVGRTVVSAYFLAGLDDRQRRERLSALVAA